MRHLLELHESPTEFRAALAYTEVETGFTQRLIEKDYYCSVVLADFKPLFAGGLVFKGGTSLSKHHAGFYRLSEDLDFAFSASTEARRSQRRRVVEPVKDHLANLADRLPGVGMPDAIRGHDDSRQYNAVLDYESVVTGERETVKVQVAIRELIIEEPVFCIGRTLIQLPLPEQPPVVSPELVVLSLNETYAEKVRAALTRTQPAIRDVYDLYHATKLDLLNFDTSEFIAIANAKLAVPGNTVVELDESWAEAIRKQLDSQLKPVLRGGDFLAFDLDSALATVREIECRLD